MNKQTLAQKRNYHKRRLMGAIAIFSPYNDPHLTTTERNFHFAIREHIQGLIDFWDKESENLGLTIRPHKCFWCGKRSNKSYLIEEKNYCCKCFKTYKDVL